MFEKFTGLQYLKMDIACKHDKAFEKENWSDRLTHFETLNLNDPNLCVGASNPIGMYAALKALQDTINGIPTGYVVSLDACSSGMQILSLLVSCSKSWSLCGGDSDNIKDSYTEIYIAMNIDDAVTRKDCKAAVMTALYGSLATPKGVFGDNIDLFYETMENEVTGAWNLNIGLQELWNEVEGNAYRWTLPDNFHCRIETHDKDLVPFTIGDSEFALPVKVKERPEFHKGLGPNLIHSIDGMIVREMVRRCSFDQDIVTKVIESITETGTDGENAGIVKTLWNWYKKTGFLSARILQYLDETTMGLVNSTVIAHLILTLPEKPFDLLTVHDCFRAHPNHGDDVRIQYNHIMADINDSSILKSIASQVIGRTVEISKVGSIDRHEILNANYTLA